MPSMPDIEVQPTSCQELTYKLNFTHPIWSITFTDWTHHFENHTFIVFKRCLTWTLPSQCLFRHLCKMSILTSAKTPIRLNWKERGELNWTMFKWNHSSWGKISMRKAFDHLIMLVWKEITPWRWLLGAQQHCLLWNIMPCFGIWCHARNRNSSKYWQST